LASRARYAYGHAMPRAKALLLMMLSVLSLLIVSSCASAVRAPAHDVAAASREVTRPRAASESPRLGPPSPRGTSLRRVDRPSSAEPPVALY
jgi:hypothetical protein